MTVGNNDFMTLSALEEDLLTVLAGNELYGWQIIKAISEASGGSRKIQFGSLYPTLHRLSKKGLIAARWGEEIEENAGGARRKYYKLTVVGKKVLQDTQQYRAQLGRWKPA